jgi:hypothetical protein
LCSTGGLDEPLGHEHLQVASQGSTCLLRQDLGDGGHREGHAQDGGACEHRALTRAQPLQAGGQQRLDGRWERQAVGSALFTERGNQLLEEERVASGRLE